MHGRDHDTPPVLRRGARGDAVTRMQERLRLHLDDLEADFVDSHFGPGTEFQVKRFQRARKLSADGVVGRDTLAALLRGPGERTAAASPAPAPGRTSSPADRQISQAEGGRADQGADAAGRIERALLRKGYQYLDDGRPFHLNIVGVRNPSTGINKFDDRMFVVYRDEGGVRHALEFPATTDPGEYYTRTKLSTRDGAAILIPGQYRDVYKLDLHGKKYEALCQRGGTVRVWRDGNMDDKLDRSGRVFEGWFGINIHRAGAQGDTAKVGKYSAGCQVLRNADHFATLIGLAHKSRDIRGNVFTYTLLEDADLT